MTRPIDSNRPVVYGNSRAGLAGVPNYGGAESVAFDDNAQIGANQRIVTINSAPGSSEKTLTLPPLAAVEIGTTFLIMRDTGITPPGGVLPTVQLPVITLEASATDGAVIDLSLSELRWIDAQPIQLLRVLSGWQLVTHSANAFGVMLPNSRKARLGTQYLTNNNDPFSIVVAAAGTPVVIQDASFVSFASIVPAIGSFDPATGIFTVGPAGSGFFLVSFAITGELTGTGPWDVEVYRNGAGSGFDEFIQGDTGQYNTVSASNLVFGASPGDTFEFRVDSGANADSLLINNINATFEYLI